MSREIRELLGAGLIIAGWLGVIVMCFKHGTNTSFLMVCIIAAFGGAWLMLPKDPTGDE